MSNYLAAGNAYYLQEVIIIITTIIYLNSIDPYMVGTPVDIEIIKGTSHHIHKTN
jgi:hypothetical protein